MTIDKEWLIEWRKQYEDDDANLEPLRGLASWTFNEFDALFAWKLGKLWPARAMASFRQKNHPAFVKTVTERAFSSSDDLAALTLLVSLKGVAEPVASAVLMAHDPTRYTVMDKRSWNSLIQNGHLRGLEDRPWIECWLPYLDVCRSLTELGPTLRDVDRALWAADGATSPYEKDS